MRGLCTTLFACAVVLLFSLPAQASFIYGGFWKLTDGDMNLRLFEDAGYDLWIYDAEDPSEEILALHEGRTFDVFDYDETSDSLTSRAGGEYLSLGESALFGFRFVKQGLVRESYTVVPLFEGSMYELHHDGAVLMTIDAAPHISPASEAPAPGALWLLGSGALALAGLRRKSAA